MAKNDGPRVPDGPTAPDANEPQRRTPSDEPRATSEERRSGGRRAYEEILDENRQLNRRLAELTESVAVLASMPIDAQQDPKRPQYALSKGGPCVMITGEQVLAARRALGMPA
jgi:hypothetical protein